MALREEMVSQGNFLFKKRSFLPVFVLVAGFFVFYKAATEDALPANHGILFISCFIIGLLGLVLRCYTVGFAASNTSGRNTSEGQVADEINTTGIYSMVRHPLYLGNFLMWLSAALLTWNFWFILAFILFYWLYYERIMLAEEDFLRGKFGDVYLIWASQTPAFLPQPHLFKKPNRSFDWKKVVLKEKNGLAALIIIFYSLDVLRLEVAGCSDSLTSSQWFIPAIGILIFYLVLKIVKTRMRNL